MRESNDDSALDNSLTRRYYSSRQGIRQLSVYDLYRFHQDLYLYFKSIDYLKEKLEITGHELPESARYRAGMELGFDLSILEDDRTDDIREERIFDTIEFLYDHISKPGYRSYDSDAGKEEYRHFVNRFLADYGPGYEMSEAGTVELIGEHGLQHIFEAEIVPYEYENVDKKVLDAITKWKSRHYQMEDRKQAILDLAGVFEWLKQEGKLTKALSRKDESALFDIANKFALRHHNPQQKFDYDINIWYSWIFHFYLATYHAAIRLIKRMEARGKLEK